MVVGQSSTRIGDGAQSHRTASSRRTTAHRQYAGSNAVFSDGTTTGRDTMKLDPHRKSLCRRGGLHRATAWHYRRRVLQVVVESLPHLSVPHRASVTIRPESTTANSVFTATCRQPVMVYRRRSCQWLYR